MPLVLTNLSSSSFAITEHCAFELNNTLLPNHPKGIPTAKHDNPVHDEFVGGRGPPSLTAGQHLFRDELHAG
jgi:hypothetical protein